MSSDLYNNIDAPIPSMDWSKEYGLSKAIIALWDLSAAGSTKLGKGEGQHGAAISSYNTETNEAVIADGIGKRGHSKVNSRKPFNPDNWVFRPHYAMYTNGFNATWDVRIIADHQNKSDSRTNGGSMVVDQAIPQQWGWLNDIAWVRKLGTPVADPEIMFDSNGFLSALLGPRAGGGSSKRGAVAIPVVRNGGFVTDGVHDGQWSQALTFIIGPAEGSDSPSRNGPGQTVAGGIPGLTAPAGTGYSQSNFNSQIHGAGGGTPGGLPSDQSPYGYNQSSSTSQVFGSGGGAPGQTPDGGSGRGFNQSDFGSQTADAGGGADRGFDQSASVGGPVSRTAIPANPNYSGQPASKKLDGGSSTSMVAVTSDYGNSAATSSGKSAGGGDGAATAVTHDAPTNSHAGDANPGPLGDTTGSSPFGTQDTTVVSGTEGNDNHSNTQTEPSESKKVKLAVELGLRADCGIDFGARLIGRLAHEPKGSASDGGYGDELRKVYLFVDTKGNNDDKVDPASDPLSNHKLIPKKVQKKIIRGTVRVPKNVPSSQHSDYSYHGDTDDSSSSSGSSQPSGSGSPTNGGSSTPDPTGHDPNDQGDQDGDAEAGAGYTGVDPNDGGSNSNTGGGTSGGTSGGGGGGDGPPPGGHQEVQTNVDADGNTWQRTVNVGADGNITNPQTPFNNLGHLSTH